MVSSPMPTSSDSTPVSMFPLLKLLRETLSCSEGRIHLGGSLVCLLLLGLTFKSNLQHLWLVWSTDENYSHGFLVPLISLYFANEAARLGPVPIRSGIVMGVILLVISMVGRLAATVVPVGIVADGAFLLGVAGVFTLMTGTAALRRYAFPLGFLVFMIPLPTALYSMVASPLQLMVSHVASAVLNTLSIPVLREGNTMTLPGDVRLFVAEACSGMRQLTGFLALTTAVAYLTHRPLWYRGLVVISSVPIALIANLARVVLTGWIMYHDPRYAVGTFHTVEGLLMMGLGLALLGGECRLLDLLLCWSETANSSDERFLTTPRPRWMSTTPRGESSPA